MTPQQKAQLRAMVDVLDVVATPAPPPPPPAPPPAPTNAFYFAANGVNSNPGTQALPKRDLIGLAINSLPAGTSLLFKRDDAFSLQNIRLRNLNATSTAPLTFGAYGDGFRPVLQFSSGNGFEFGLNFGDTTNHGHYVFRGLAVHGADNTNGFGFWCKNNIHDVLIEHCTITNWHVGVNGQGGGASTRIVVQHNSIFNNRAMGWLGEFYDSSFHDNDFSGPGLPSHHFVHLGYLRGGRNISVTNNKVTSTGPAQGGTLTAHGLIDGLHIEGNVFEYGPGSDEGAWVISLIPDTGNAPGGFTRLVVRGNTVQNGGNNGIHVESAPNAVIENNILRLTAPRYQTAVAFGDDPGRPNNLVSSGIVRGNRAYGPEGTQFGWFAPAGVTMEDNLAIIE